jgi:anaerobic selenocysteine-containing dehydrogenase
MPTTYGYTTSNIVWGNWVNVGTSTATNVVNDFVWTTWNNSTITYHANTIHVPPQRTPEQEAAHQEELLQARERWARTDAESKAAAAEAKRKARVILEENLTDGQRKQLADGDWFEVVTPKGTYRIRTGISGNVDRYVKGRATDRYCIHPTETVPAEDNMLIQKLLLETDEDAFLRIANRSAPMA